MAESREQVKAMISTLRARLNDLEEIVDSYEGDLTGYSEKLDRIDDKVYLLEVELEKAAAKAAGGADCDANGAGDSDEPAETEPAAQDGEEGAEGAEGTEGEEGSSSELVEDVKDIARDLGDFAKSGMKTFDELKGVIDDATSAFRDEEGNNKLAPYLDKAAKISRHTRRRW